MNRLFSRGQVPRRPPPSAEDLYTGPIRGELLGAERLAERARALARAQQSITERRRRRYRERPARLLIRLAQTRRILDEANERLTAAAAHGTDIGPAGDWLLDNFHVIREQAGQVRESLPAGYFRELPLLTHGALAEYPRIYEIAITLISHSEARIDLDNVDVFVGAYQEQLDLSLGELWAIPAMLRLGLLESVRRMTLRTLQRLDEVEAADAWTGRILGEGALGTDAMHGALAAFVEAGHPLTPTFVSRLLQQLRASAGAVPPLVGIEHWLAEEGMGPTEASSRAAERLALTTLVMANSIMSLRSIGPRDWRQFVEHQSVVDRTLREDPSGDYAHMTFATRDSYRHAVERMARDSDVGEREVAERVVRHAQHVQGTPRQRHIGYWLVDDGVTTFEDTLDYRPPPALRARRWLRDHPNLVYGGGIAVGTALALSFLLAASGPLARVQWLPVAFVGFLLAFDIAVNVMGQLVTTFLPPNLLPRLDFAKEGVPASSRTAVVIPTIFGSVAAVEAALSGLEVQFLANRGAHLHYALLSDDTDAPTRTCERDGPIIAAARRGIESLNARYAPATSDAFYLFHRDRQWNPQEGVWMGWERKRGKLAEFNRFLRNETSSHFAVIVGDVAAIRASRYVITLDADTVLPPDEAAALIGTIAHPLNRPVFDPVRSRIVEGFGILQPRVGISLESAQRSRFAAVHSGHPGVDPYTTAVSDVYQDLYGEGSYIGKGIYDVDLFETATHGRFPENTLLSHDLIEGNYARAGLVTDLTVFDDYPAHYLTFWRRRHRWIRGDWQLLRWLTRTVPGPSGPERNRLSLLARWKILDNLRRSLVELALLVFLVLGWTLLPDLAWRWTTLGLLAAAAPWIVAMGIALVAPSRDKSLRVYYAAVWRDAITSVQQLSLTVVFLPQQAWLAADAISRTLWRLAVSRRRLLEWQPAALAEQMTHRSLSHFWRTMWPAVAVPVLGFVWLLRSGDGVGAVTSTAPLYPVALLVALWCTAPFVAYAMSLPHDRRREPFTDADRETTRRYARDHWAFFDTFATEATGWLTPDNVQEDPERVVAMRTSPTNIGLHLLATVSAHDLGFIALTEMVERLERTMQRVTALPRFRGHLFNWYALPGGTVLEPAYVSTVDSGNLAGHLIALRQACRGLASRPHPEARAVAARLESVAQNAETLALGMDFAFLFDPAVKLFRIGYTTSTHQYDAATYDLLASEARLASFIAIAKHDVGPEHWFHLGRGLTRTDGHAALVSWSGSMFEYLMPLLVMRAFHDTLLGRTYEGALARQIGYAAARGVPWGVSESAYNVRDRHLTYQYRAFGVPDLALQRGLADDLVVAPYASALAMAIDPGCAIANLTLLESMGAYGAFGFVDALDWTRPSGDRAYAVVRCHMSHHIGMSLVAFTNALLDDVWQERFHADPMVRAASLLLDERVPRRLEFQQPQRVVLAEPKAEVLDRPVVREYETVDTLRPHVALLGHAPLTVMVTHAGGGYSRCEGLAVTRWRSDGTRDDTGQFCYVRDCTTGRVWSSGHQPTGTLATRYRAQLATDRVTIDRSDGVIDTRTEIVVAPEDSAEIRRVTLTNTGNTTHEVELTSYGEIVLAPHAADRAHPAFGNLFVETEWHAWCNALTARRRPRASTDAPVWCAHVVDAGPQRIGALSFESDRSRFIGRGRTLRDPVALDDGATLSGTTGAVLDPIFAIRVRLRLAPGASESVAFTTIVAATRERLFALADRYHSTHAAQRALDLAWTSTRVELRELGISPSDAAAYQELAGYILFPDGVTRLPHPAAAQNQGWQQILWAHGISGDAPLVFATIDAPDGLASLHSLLTAHRYWHLRGVQVDLLVVCDEPQSYQQNLRERILALMLATGGSAVLDAHGGVHLRNRSALGTADLETITALAHLRITCDGRPLARMVADVVRNTGAPESTAVRVTRGAGRDTAPETVTPTPIPRVDPTAPSLPAGGVDPELRFATPFGGMTADDRYRIAVRGDHLPPAPWANVIANARGGFVVTERGGGFTWASSSYFFRLTPWFNDPVSDPVGDALYLRDEDSGEFWSATPAPVHRDIAFTVEHGAGRSTFAHEYRGILAQLTLGVAGNDPVRLSLLQVTNQSARTRRLSLTSYVEWTLGTHRELTQHRVRTRFEAAHGAVLADNPFDPVFASWVAFSAMSGVVSSHTGDRREFIGRNGSLADPSALHSGDLSGRAGSGVDPCAALRSTFVLAPGESTTIVVLLGAAPDDASAQALLAQHRDVDAARTAMGASTAEWDRRLSVVTIRTPVPSFDAIVNRWTLYQTLACRMWARAATYQSSGAFGFRDQLQDAMALVYAEPGLARAHLLRAAARQFAEGDVQHWWHPETGRGVRTRFSDDLAWLPYVVEHYVRVTGDIGVLDESVPYLEMRALGPDEHEVYDMPSESADHSSLYEHCRRALARAMTAGTHGLPLIGTGDWNDGFSRVGKDGHGESVWLGWFLIATARAFAPLADGRHDPQTAHHLRSRADGYARAIEADGWDGAWYRRGYFDDGTPLGSDTQDECRIDSIAQSWSVISDAGAAARRGDAMRSLEYHLVDIDARVIRLLTPPFDRTAHDPGYIKGYLPGVRENGAQYTHAALWAVMAAARNGESERALLWFQMLNPLTHTDTAEGVLTYRVEPYVVAADVYTMASSRGRGGWTWYTGSASWMYRVALEEILGFRKVGDAFSVLPCVPVSWPEFTLTYRFGRSHYEITVVRPGALRTLGVHLTVDGVFVPIPEHGGWLVPLCDDGATHVVLVRPRDEPAVDG